MCLGIITLLRGFVERLLNLQGYYFVITSNWGYVTNFKISFFGGDDRGLAYITLRFDWAISSFDLTGTLARIIFEVLYGRAARFSKIGLGVGGTIFGDVNVGWDHVLFKGFNVEIRCLIGGHFTYDGQGSFLFGVGCAEGSFISTVILAYYGGCYVNGFFYGGFGESTSFFFRYFGYHGGFNVVCFVLFGLFYSYRFSRFLLGVARGGVRLL